uniref:Putative lipoprotein n=1 Tax=Polynucleobacter necessarius subsp. necessarius (strain STIR1) TaxID=452638 RepID=B1XVX2_POLNS
MLLTPHKTVLTIPILKMTIALTSLSKIIAVTLIAAAFLVSCQSTGPNDKPLTLVEISQKRDATLKMAKTGLDALIKKNPAVQKEIDQSAGYAVFTTTNVNVFLLVVARGEGVLFDKRRKDPIFMQALKTGEGLGAGYQDQYQVAIFKSPAAIDQFLLTSIDGQRGGVDVDANFSAGSGGTIRSFNPEITFYTVGLSGYDLQANYGGTLYLVDQQLNNAATLNNLPKKK